MGSGQHVAVIGGGTMGSMIAWRLAERGARATVFEQFSPGHDRSAAGGETRIFRTAYVEGPQYIPLLRGARDLWRELEKDSGRELLREIGVLTIGTEDSQAMRNALAGIDEYGLDCDVLPSDEISVRFPQHAVTGSDMAIFDRAAGFLRPELSVAMAAQRAEAAGAQIQRYVRVEAVEPRADGVMVRAGGREVRFDTAVVAAGPWTTRLLPQLDRVVDVQRRLQAWFLPRTPGLWFDRPCPVFMRTGDGDRYYGIPSVDGISVKVGVTGDNDDPVSNPDKLDRTVEPSRLSPHRKILSTYLPDLLPDPIRVGAYQEAYTPDHHALLGFSPDSENIIVAGAFSGHGFKLSPMIGEVVADLAISGETAVDITHLSPTRFTS